MHIRLRMFAQKDMVIVVESKLSKIEVLRHKIKDKLGVAPDRQRLLYGGKLLENGFTLYDYNIKLNEVIQLMMLPEKKPDEQDNSAQAKEPLRKKSTEKEVKEVIKYEETTSVLYLYNELVDVLDRDTGSWVKGKIIRFVCDPDAPPISPVPVEKVDSKAEQLESPKIESKNKPLRKSQVHNSKNTQDISKFFTPKKAKQTNGSPKSESSSPMEVPKDVNLLYEVKLEDDDDNSIYCMPKEVRPQARNKIDTENLKVGQKVMVNYNVEQPQVKGLWYDFQISNIMRHRSRTELKGTLYVGLEGIPHHDVVVKLTQPVFAIEEVVPLVQRNYEYIKMMITPTEPRAKPVICLACLDSNATNCKECGCYICAGKKNPDEIILCDECNKGYHMQCLDPPLEEIPEDDWYCPSCKRDPNEVVAPGAAKQKKKVTNNKTRDWGRGMACVGKTKSCPMPPNHLGPIPGVEVGMRWRYRIQLSETGVHRPPVSGIHGRAKEGAFSLVLSGGYEDDLDNGDEFTYTGSGGRDLSGNKRTAEQSSDQKLIRENKALALNCCVKLNDKGADAGNKWREGKPVRVIRSYNMKKHFPKYAPEEGVRYDGIYKVVKYYQEKGLSGFYVWKYLLRRDDPSPAPWEPNAKQFDIIYPDGHLEAMFAEQERKELNRDSASPNQTANNNLNSSSDEDVAPPAKKLKQNSPNNSRQNSPNKSRQNSPNKSRQNSPNKSRQNSPNRSRQNSPKPKGKGGRQRKRKSPSPKRQQQRQPAALRGLFKLSEEEISAIEADKLNTKLWKECMEMVDTEEKRAFLQRVTELFQCIICQDVVKAPVTTPCFHNFCSNCLRTAFKTTKSMHCPYCRQCLVDYTPKVNEALKAALRAVMSGYDAGHD